MEREILKRMQRQDKGEWLQTRRTGLDEILGKIIYCEGGETLEESAQKSSRCPIPVNVEGQVGWGSDQCGLVEGIPF